MQTDVAIPGAGGADLSAAIAQGREAFDALLSLATPLGIAFQVVTLVFTLHHTFSWFNVTPKAMPVQVGEEFLPDSVIVGAHYVVWIAVSIVVLAFAGAL